jgi:hypothetical protein
MPDNRSDTLRSKALACEERARTATDELSSQHWQELARQWHSMARLAATTAEYVPQNEMA